MNLTEKCRIQIFKDDKIITKTQTEPFDTVAERQRAMRLYNLFAERFPLHLGFTVRLVAYFPGGDKVERSTT